MKLIFVFIIGIGLCGTGWCSLPADEDPESIDVNPNPEINSKDPELIDVNPNPEINSEDPELIDINPNPEINPEDGYIFEFMSRGIDMTSQSLLGNLSLGALKKRIFKYNSSVIDENALTNTSNPYIVYFVPNFIRKFKEEQNSTWNEIVVFNSESDLNKLLDAEKATFMPRGYAQQVVESSRYGIVSAVTIYFNSLWEVVPVEISNENYLEYLDDEFVEAVKQLPEEYNEETQEQFAHFINNYGMHYLTFGKFGGMFVMESRTNSNFVDNVTVPVYENYLKENLNRFFDFNDTDAERFDETIPTDFYRNNQYENSTYGGYEPYPDIRFRDIMDRKVIKQWIDTIELNPVFLDGYAAPISKLIKFIRPEAVQAFDTAIDVAFKKYKIRAYFDALRLVKTNAFARGFTAYDPLTDYFYSLLNETDPNLDSESFEENSKRTRAFVETILNDRNLPKPAK